MKERHLGFCALIATIVTVLSGVAGCQLIGGYEGFTAGGAAGTGASPTGGSSGNGGTAGMGANANGGSGGFQCGSPRETKTSMEMRALAHPNGSCFWMDATEVPNSDYEEFLGSLPSLQAQSDECRSWNDDFHPNGCATDQGPMAGPSDPVTCIDHCDAEAFCAWAGKSLCEGAFGNGSEVNPDKSEWYAACSSNDSNSYPYGNSYQKGLCNGQDRPGTGCSGGTCSLVPVGTLTSCVTPGGIFDLSGNVAEWVAECDGISGATDNCNVRGGAVNDPSDSLRCRNAVTHTRDFVSNRIGFRCCVR